MRKCTRSRYAGDHASPGDFRIYVGPGAPQSDAPIATALREECIVVCDDFRNDPRTRTWHELARRLGVASSIAAPVRERGRVCGALALYVDSERFFDAEIQRLAEEMSQGVRDARA